MKSSREILKATGEPESEEVVNDLEKQAKIRAEKSFKDPELLDILGEINFPYLSSLLEEIARKSGIDSEKINFVNPDRITGSSFGIASYSARDNNIGISYGLVKEKAEKLNLSPSLFTFLMLCHEEVHATAKVVCRGSFLDEKEVYTEQTGYYKKIGEFKEKKGYFEWIVLFSMFNEGVTEKLSREVAGLYLSDMDASFTSRDDLNRLRKLYSSGQEEMPYSIEVEFIDILIAKISKKTGIAKDQTWKAIVRGMYEGESFKDEELKQLFSDMFGADFLTALSQADQHQQIKILTDRIRDGDIEL